jgi:hypothetical protein
LLHSVSQWQPIGVVDQAIEDGVGDRWVGNDLKPGRKYEEAVQTFQPYEQTKEVNAEARQAGAALIAAEVKAKGRKTFI